MHLILAILETVPLIGQVVTLIEAVLARKLLISDEALAQKREEALEFIKSNPIKLGSLPFCFRRDKEIVLEVAKNPKTVGLVIRYAHKDLRKDEDVMLAAVESNASMLKYARIPYCSEKSEKMELAAVKGNGLMLEYVHPDLKKDEETVRAAFKNNNLAIKYAHEDLRNDKEFMLPLIEENWKTLEYAGDSLKKNEEVVQAAIDRSKGGHALQHAHEDLRNKKEFILPLVEKKNGWLLYYAGDSLKKDKDVVIAAVTQDPTALELAHKSLKNDKEVLLAAQKKSLELNKAANKS